MFKSSATKDEPAFIRVTTCDTMGISRSKVVHRDTYPQIKKSGLSIPNVTCILSSESIPADYPKISDAGYPDVFIIPEADTWHLCPWSGSKSGRKIAQVFGEMHQKDKNSTPCGFDPRVVCKKLLGSLEKEFGLSLYSALEYEFAMAKDGKPVTSKMHIYSPVGLKATEDFCFEVSDRLEKAGVLLETIMHEHGQGQLELTMKPYWGIKAADHALMYKQCVKETAIDLGFRATFMCNPWLAVQSGGHYNFSLWNKSGTNVFTDDSDSDGLSDLAKNWIAGVLEHAPAITALVCHTNNCYNRFYEGGFAPYHICYAEENRSSLVRVKRSESSGTYLEYRGGGAAANPYLVLSAILAAGIDGLRKKLTPPPPGFNEEKEIPRNLDTSLNALEQDQVMCEMIGEDLITPFLLLKRQHDLNKTTLEAQIESYADLI